MTDIRQRMASLTPEKRALLEERLAQSSSTKSRRSPLVRDENAIREPSLGQERLWALERIEGSTARYNLCYCLSLKGVLEFAALKSALSSLVNRHETLRTSYNQNPEGQLRIELCVAFEVPFTITDFSAALKQEREELLRAALRAEANRPIVLGRDPVIRAVLYKLSECEHALQLTIHHVASDGWSMEVLFHDFAAFYNAAVTHTAPQLPELPVAFSDYAHWQRQQLAGPEGERLISYWKEQLREGSFVLELPTDRPHPPEPTFRGADRRYSMPASLATAIKGFCVREQVTPFMVALAALYAVLARYSGQNDITIGSTIAARSRIEVENLVGYLTNTVVLRGQLDGDPTFRKLLQQVRQTTLGANAHQDIPIDLLIGHVNPERDVRRSIMFQVMLVYQDAPVRGFNLHGLNTSVEELKPNASLFELVIELLPSGETFDGVIQYSSDLFDSDTIDRLWAHLTGYIHQAIEAPEQPADAICLLTPEERQQLLAEQSAGARAYPASSSVGELFEAQAARTPEALALLSGEQRLTYFELNERANLLAHQLLRLGVQPGEKVGIAIDRSSELIAGIVAILKAGAAYVPIDPGYPQERRDFILRDCGIRFLLTVFDGEHMTTESPFVTDCKVEFVNAGFNSTPVADGDGANPPARAGLDSPAYVMYTSGSTGRPKGVEISHRGIVRLVVGSQFAEWNDKQVFLQLAPVSFDASTFEIWGALLHGARLALFKGSPASPDAIGSALLQYGVTTLWLTASLFNTIVDIAPGSLAPVRQLLVGGEALSVPHVIRALRALPNTELINGYGPTECTTFACCYRIPRDQAPESASIPIGRPIASTWAYILDRHLQPLPIGAVGELYIGGDGLALGYLNQPELTRASFISNPFRPAERLYKTGDLVRRLLDGNLEFAGRADQQVKIRGYRIELGEIEAVLKEQPEINQAIVLAREDTPGDKRLVAYLVSSPGVALSPSEIRQRLKQRLPDFMLPSAYVFLDQLPISPNGKIDRKALQAPQQELAEASDNPRSALEETLARIWTEVLNVPRVGIHDDFFEMGGHSLLAVRLFSKILAAIPECQPTLALLVKAPTVAQFAQIIADGHAEWSYLVRLREGGVRPPIFFVSGAGGNVLSLRGLAGALPPDQPFYALQGRGLDGHSLPFFSVEEAAECYIEQIRIVQPHGPYFLGGLSYGGIVAFEMACRLRSAGEAVGVLALIDTYNYAYGCFLSKPMLLYFNSRYFLQRTLLHMKVLVRMKPKNWSGYLLGRAKVFRRLAANITNIARGRVGTTFPKDIPGGQFKIPESLEEILRQVRTASLKALQNFVPKPYDGHLLLFRASIPDPGDPYLDAALGWRALALGGITICEIDGDHDSLIYWPKVAAIAEKLDSAIREVQ